MKKILFLIHDLGQGGAEKVLVNLVNNMDKTKFDITLISLFGGGVNEQFLKEHIHYHAVFPRSFPGNSKVMKLFTPKQLHRWIIKDQYDIEISYLEGPSARIISGCPDSDTKLISWIHVQQYSREIAAQAFRSFTESVECYQRFDKVVCVSESVKDDFLNLYPMLKGADVLYNTNETDQILEMKDEKAEAAGFDGNSIRLCGVGKILPNKGFDKFARIHKKLRDDGFDVYSYVLGSGPEKESIENYLRENKIEDTFLFLGYQTNPYKYVANCDVFVCASIAEGFSTAATEALIVGVPVVTTPVAGMEEMLGKNGEYGIITEMSEESLYEHIRDLIGNREKLKDYKKRAAERGKYFSKENTVKAVEEYLEELMR